MTWFEFTVAALATYRLAFLLAYEEGPFALAKHLRASAMPGTWVYNGLRCVKCWSFWLAWPVIGLTLFWWGDYIVYALALSGAVVLLDQALALLAREEG